jgi:hypothetical protein
VDILIDRSGQSSRSDTRSPTAIPSCFCRRRARGRTEQVDEASKAKQPAVTRWKWNGTRKPAGRGRRGRNWIFSLWRTPFSLPFCAGSEPLRPEPACLTFPATNNRSAVTLNPRWWQETTDASWTWVPGPCYGVGPCLKKTRKTGLVRFHRTAGF